MRHALHLAGRGTGTVSPNPRVGCVVVNDQDVLAEGWHHVYGGLHAEAEALSVLRRPIPDSAVMYVTLEPCAHHAKQPPCADAIIASGIKTVVVGMEDPYPLVHGKGLARLREHGVQVIVGVLEDECTWINRWFIKHGTTQKPYVIVKVAQTPDGVIAPEPRSRLALSSNRSRQRVHALRAEVDAVMVGLQTVVTDDPELSVRDVQGRNPARIVVDPDLQIPVDSTLVRTARAERTVVIAGNNANHGRREELHDRGVEVVCVQQTHNGLDLEEAFALLGKSGIASILCEGGPVLATSLISADLVDELQVYSAPLLIGRGHRIGPLPHAVSLRLHHMESIEQDVVCTYLPSTP